MPRIDIYFILFNRTTEQILRLLLDNGQYDETIQTLYDNFKVLQQDDQKNDEKEILNLFKSFLKDEYKSKIQNKNETLFAITWNEISLENTFDWNIVFKKIQNCWVTSPNSIKNLFWVNLQQLVALSHHCD